MQIGKTITTSEAVAITVGVVIGAGIFRTPPLVALASPNPRTVLLLWLVGGAISLAGALCYAELSTAYPDPGGEYRYLTRAYGRSTGFLFAWARMTVIQPGSIAMVGFLTGEYASGIYRLSGASAAKYAAFTVIAGTATNIAGIRFGKRSQLVLTSVLLAGLAVVAATGFWGSPPSNTTIRIGILDSGRIGRALIFVLLTYGGWSEAAYLSSELRGSSRGMVRVLLLSIGIITAVYFVVNAALFHGLGFAVVSRSEAVTADLMRRTFGQSGAVFISLLVILASYSTLNAMVITGARTSYALGKDFPRFARLGKWDLRSGAPVNALLVQGLVSLVLVAIGAEFRSGFVAMVEYTAPVFWLFLLLGGISLLVLRHREPDAPRPFRAPLYPVTPLIFCASCVYLIRAALTNTGWGAIVGMAVLASGIPFVVRDRLSRRTPDIQRNTDR